MESSQGIRLLNDITGQLLALGAEDFQELAQITKDLEELCRCEDWLETHRRAAAQAIEQIKLVILQEVLDIEGKDIEEAPSFGTDVDTNFILGMGKIGDSVKILLDIDKVLGGCDVRNERTRSDLTRRRDA